MNLYLISQEVNNDYDTYDSAIVCAKNGDEAKEIHPDGYLSIKDWPFIDTDKDDLGSWAKIENVKVKLVGLADKNIKKGVVCASFRTG
jgi:hypothetical protein